MSRSVAGSFDNEAVAIFALLLTFYLWTRAVQTGTVAAGVCCAFAYLYMAASWCVGSTWDLLQGYDRSCAGRGSLLPVHDICIAK